MFRCRSLSSSGRIGNVPHDAGGVCGASGRSGGRSGQSDARRGAGGCGGTTQRSHPSEVATRLERNRDLLPCASTPSTNKNNNLQQISSRKFSFSKNHLFNPSVFFIFLIFLDIHLFIVFLILFSPRKNYLKYSLFFHVRKSFKLIIFLSVVVVFILKSFMKKSDYFPVWHLCVVFFF